MILVLDTTDRMHIRVGLSRDATQLLVQNVLRSREGKKRPDVALAVQDLLRTAHIRTVHGVIVRDRAGTFSGVRLGILLANAFVLTHKVPAVSVDCGVGDVALTEVLRRGASKLTRRRRMQYLVPHYHKAPHITQPKKRTRPIRRTSR